MGSGDDVGYSFNSRNDISQTRVASNTGTDVVNYGYDLIGRLNQVSAATGKWGAVAGARGGTWDTTFVGWSQMPLTQNQPNGMYNEWTYEGAGTLQRLTKVSNKISASSPVLSRFFYGYNAPGQGALDTRSVVSKQYGDNAGQIQSTNYSYNATSVLTGESAAGQNAQTPPVSNSYQFDAMGNRTDWRDSVALKSGSSSYNSLNQLTQTNLYDLAPGSLAPTYTGTVNYGYDNDGNTTSSQLGASNTLYAYDEENRLTSITSTSNGQPSSKSEFVYDGMSRLRISRYYANINGQLVQQNEKRRVYDGMDIVQERDQNNTVTASLTRAGNIGGILARTTNAGNVFYGYDGNGNVTTLTNNAGAEVGSYTYDAFGNTVATSGSSASENPYRFSTKEQIGGLYSYGLRFYSPGLGRWINRDPIREAGGTNLYGFVGNDPVNSVDEYGLKDYGADWVEQQRAMWRANDTNLYWGAWNHGTHGKFDYKSDYPEGNGDRFLVNGRWLSSGGLGNYAVGYGSYWGGGYIGVGGAAALGHPFEAASRLFAEPRTDNYTGYLDPPQDRRLIGEGGCDARDYINSKAFKLTKQYAAMKEFLPDYNRSSPVSKKPIQRKGGRR